MKTVLVRDIPQDVYDKIVESSKKNDRSVNAEIRFLIKKALNLKMWNKK